MDSSLGLRQTDWHLPCTMSWWRMVGFLKGGGRFCPQTKYKHAPAVCTTPKPHRPTSDDLLFALYSALFRGMCLACKVWP